MAPEQKLIWVPTILQCSVESKFRPGVEEWKSLQHFLYFHHVWVVGLIHSSGWFYAIAIVAATGAVGAGGLAHDVRLGRQRVLGVGSLAVLGNEEE